MRSDVELNTVSQWLSVGWLTGDGEDLPSIACMVGACPPGNESVVSVDVSLNSEAMVVAVSDVSSVSTVELNWLSLLTSVSSDGSASSWSETLTHLVGENPVLVVWVSDGVGS